MTDVARIIFLLDSAGTDLQRMNSATNAGTSEKLQSMDEISAGSGKVLIQALNYKVKEG